MVVCPNFSFHALYFLFAWVHWRFRPLDSSDTICIGNYVVVVQVMQIYFALHHGQAISLGSVTLCLLYFEQSFYLSLWFKQLAGWGTFVILSKVSPGVTQKLWLMYNLL